MIIALLAWLHLTSPLPYNIPDDDTLNAEVDATQSYVPTLSEPRWVVPAANLPADLPYEGASNNNVALAYHDGRLYMAWRTAPIHFASNRAHMNVVSSADLGQTWTTETSIFMGSDLREPFFLDFKGHFILSFFQAGIKAAAFEPQHMWRIEKRDDGTWTTPQTWGRPGEIPWELKVRNGRAWMTSYRGAHYSANGAVDLYFSVSDDGVNWAPVNPAHPVIYHGGVSEVGFDFDGQGDLWAITRNEDGDASGFGSHFVSASHGELGDWQFPARSSPVRYDSPRVFRHGHEIYLIARRDPKGPFDKGYRWLPFTFRKWALLAAYSKRPKRTALYRFDREHRRMEWIFDLPGDGDTAFPSIVRLDAHTYLIGNYTSPLRYPGRSWIWGQLSPQGTQIYFTLLKFQQAPSRAY